MRALVFEGNTWSDYEKLRSQKPQLHKALRKLLKEMQRADPAIGAGKPEQLRNELSGFWSRRISQRDRVTYKFDDDYIYIFAIGGHYEQFQ